MADAALTDRIDGIAQLGSVVRAMTGIAGARARTSRSQVTAVDAYAKVMVAAYAQVAGGADLPLAVMRPALVLFCAEQGFVGAYSERVLDAADTEHADVFVIGSRGAVIAEARGLIPTWSAPLPARSASVPKFADQILAAVLAQGKLRPVSVVHTIWEKGQAQVTTRALYPFAPQSAETQRPSPLHNLAMGDLVVDIALDRLHADMTRAALHAFAAENEARMAAMSAASRQIEEELERLNAQARRDRQESITSEIIEIASGALAAG
jgi:F-type H+-transporting ATPase subunit gamma